MTTQRMIWLYLLTAYAIIIPICGVVLILYFLGITLQGTIYGFIAIAIGGLSTAFAGSLVAKKFRKISSYKELIKDFFCFKQPIIYYLIPIIFLLIIFGSRIFQRQLREGQYWSKIPQLFITAILFGGIEEIGWRYIFQPTLEKKFSFILGCIYNITKSLWLCVFYHATLNAFSQAFIAPIRFGSALIIIINITLSIVFVMINKKYLNIRKQHIKIV